MGNVVEKELTRIARSKRAPNRAVGDDRAAATALARMLAYIDQEMTGLNAPLTQKLAQATLQSLKLELKIDLKGAY